MRALTSFPFRFAVQYDYCKVDWRSPSGNPVGRNIITGVRNQQYCCATQPEPPHDQDYCS